MDNFLFMERWLFQANFQYYGIMVENSQISYTGIKHSGLIGPSYN